MSVLKKEANLGNDLFLSMINDLKLTRKFFIKEFDLNSYGLSHWTVDIYLKNKNVLKVDIRSTNGNSLKIKRQNIITINNAMRQGMIFYSDGSNYHHLRDFFKSYKIKIFRNNGFVVDYKIFVRDSKIKKIIE